ncbi:uncharacterized protein LOC144159736 [Haemaphysalis longicornis]
MDNEQCIPDFSLAPDGLFHLCNQTYVKKQQAEKMFKNKKGSILVRDAAQAIWGVEKLSQRSVRANLASGKDEEEAVKQLTAAKVEVVYACLEHWGRIRNEDTKVAAAGVLRTLSDKIQDVKRKLRLAKDVPE